MGMQISVRCAECRKNSLQRQHGSGLHGSRLKRFDGAVVSISLLSLLRRLSPLRLLKHSLEILWPYAMALNSTNDLTSLTTRLPYLYGRLKQRLIHVLLNRPQLARRQPCMRN
ncbi:hypothetical protein APT63_04525 [Pseudomonas sp. 22-AL-CL-001]|nr:hypothetical protein APT63_04525 [Pseudomonas monteilii]